MEPYKKSLHHAHTKVWQRWVILFGVTIIAISAFYNIHWITPGKVSTPFTNDISWGYRSSTLVDACIYFICIFTFYYFRLILTKYKLHVMRMRNVAIGMTLFFSILCVIGGETEAGRLFIKGALKETVFVDILLPDYYGVVFAFWLGTFGGVCIGIVFGILGLFNIAIEGVVICTLMGTVSGIVAFVELAWHKGIFAGLLYGSILIIGNVLINAFGISVVGAPLALLQKFSSISTDRSERAMNRYRDRLKRK